MSKLQSHGFDNQDHQIDEHEYYDMFEGKLHKMVQEIEFSYMLCHLPIDKGRASKDICYLAQVTLNIFNDENRPMDEKSIQERCLLITAWENKEKTNYKDTRSFIERLEKIAGGNGWISDYAKRLKRIRSRNHWTQAAMAKEIGIDRTLLSKTEKGERDIPARVVDWLRKRK